MGDWASLVLVRALELPEPLLELADDLEEQQELAAGWRLLRYADPGLAEQPDDLLAALTQAGGTPVLVALLVDSDSLDLTGLVPGGRPWRVSAPPPGPIDPAIAELFDPDPWPPAGWLGGAEAIGALADWASAAGLSANHDRLRTLCTEPDLEIFAGMRTMRRLLVAFGLIAG